MAAGIVNMDKFTNRARELTRRIFPDIPTDTVVAISKDNPADSMLVGQWLIQSVWDGQDWPGFRLWKTTPSGRIAMPGRWYSFWETYRHAARMEFEKRLAAAAGAVMQPDLEPTT